MTERHAFLLFSWADYEARGGHFDFRGAHPTLEAAQVAVARGREENPYIYASAWVTTFDGVKFRAIAWFDDREGWLLRD